ncbi:hypothetical protein D770_03765 [Flammeovirgaceae bacterium 311]|nr:hypothetical protein D770_03765 [Flammeovirgaceae bacterium 311]
MGFLPIIIALLAFVLLLVLVNYNSIQARQQSLGMALFTVCQSAKSRNALLKRLRGIQSNPLCPQLPEHYNFNAAQRDEIVKFIASEWVSLSESDFYLKNTSPTPATARYATALHVLNHRQRINLRTFERKVREYNQLLEGYPTTMVAGLYRIKPIRLATVRK